MDKAEMKTIGRRALEKMQRKQFTVSRKVSGATGGDVFFSLNVEMEEGSTKEECQIAYLLAFLECHETAFRAARAGSLITSDEKLDEVLKVLKHNFSHMIAGFLSKDE